LLAEDIKEDSGAVYPLIPKSWVDIWGIIWQLKQTGERQYSWTIQASGFATITDGPGGSTAMIVMTAGIRRRIFRKGNDVRWDFQELEDTVCDLCGDH
jgi:hypothetical protein